MCVCLRLMCVRVFVYVCVCTYVCACEATRLIIQSQPILVHRALQLRLWPRHKMQLSRLGKLNCQRASVWPMCVSKAKWCVKFIDVLCIAKFEERTKTARAIN